MNRTLISNSIINLYMLFVQTRKILFSGKFYYVFGFSLLWVGFIITMFHLFPGGPDDPVGIFYMLNLLPMFVVTLYVSMMLVMFEKDNITIETVFSVPGSPYKVWSYKLTVQFIVLLFIEIILALISFFFVTDFQISVMVIHIIIPIFFISNFNFFLSTVFKNGYAAGLVTIIFLFINFTLVEPLEHSAWFLYLCPFNKPNNLDVVIWNEKLLYNKSGLFSLGLVFMYFGLNKLRNREPFIE